MALLLTVIAAIILTSVTTAIHRKWSAVEQELYVQQELMTYNPATTLLDLCMAWLVSSSADHERSTVTDAVVSLLRL